MNRPEVVCTTCGQAPQGVELNPASRNGMTPVDQRACVLAGASCAKMDAFVASLQAAWAPDQIVVIVNGATDGEVD